MKKDRAEMFTTGQATDDWYDNWNSYDFKENRAKIGAEDKSDKFTQLVWRSLDTVSFGIRDQTVVAWYCKTKKVGGNSPRTKSAFMQNVQKKCVEGFGAARWNMCYNER